MRVADLIPKGGLAWGRPVTTVVNWWMNDPIGANLDRIYGQSAKFTYSLSQMTTMAKTVASFLSLLSDPASIDKENRERIESERKNGELFMQEYGIFLRDNEFGIRKVFPELRDEFGEVSQLLGRSQPTKRTFALTEQKLEVIINLFAPEYYELSERFKRGNQLTESLKACKPGQANWRKYEEVGTQILRFLFVPPFKRVIEQSRTEAGDTRRDAVLPNNQYSGFWQLIRDEFDSRHIICEFKNYSSKASKGELNQLRLYLAKPTVGRFGLLFVRKAPSKQLLAARKRAYEESQVLILLLNDELVEKMLKMRAFTGHPEEILEDLKIEFELSY